MFLEMEAANTEGIVDINPRNLVIVSHCVHGNGLAGDSPRKVVKEELVKEHVTLKALDIEEIPFQRALLVPTIHLPLL